MSTTVRTYKGRDVRESLLAAAAVAWWIAVSKATTTNTVRIGDLFDHVKAMSDDQEELLGIAEHWESDTNCEAWGVPGLSRALGLAHDIVEWVEDARREDHTPTSYMRHLRLRAMSL